MCRLKIKVDKMISKGREEDILHWQACSAWNDAFRLWPSPLSTSLQARKLETQNLARLSSSRPIFIRDDTDLYFWLELCREQFQHREGPTLTTWLLTMCHTLCMMISPPPFFSLPLPRFHQKSEASCWVGWRWNKKRHNFQWHRHCHCHCQKWWGRYGDNGWRDLDTSAHCDDTQAMWAKETKHESQHLGMTPAQTRPESRIDLR